MAQKMVCTISGVRVSKQKHREPVEKGRPQKKSQVEVELEAESEESGTRSWKQEVASALLGLRESMEDQNELLREQNSYLHRIAMHLENGLGPEEGEVLVEDSTIRE